MRRHLAGLGLASVLALAACSATAPGDVEADADAAAEPAGTVDASTGHDHGHTHGAGAGAVPAGDGTTAYRIGYTLRDVRLPRTAGEAGRISFVVENYRGRPQTGFLEEQTKRMHVYVVRDDLAVFRHVHPDMRPDGTWVGNLTLPEPGDYRVVAEFMARDDGGNGDLVMLGAPATVPGRWDTRPAPDPVGAASDWGVEAAVDGPVTAGDDGELRLRLSTPEGRAPAVGRYLGSAAHVTGFHVRSGAAVHMHPLGEPTSSPEAEVLTFHTQLPRAGDYVLFVQVVVDDFLHTLPVTVTAV